MRTVYVKTPAFDTKDTTDLKVVSAIMDTHALEKLHTQKRWLFSYNDTEYKDYFTAKLQNMKIADSHHDNETRTAIKFVLSYNWNIPLEEITINNYPEAFV